MSALVLGMKVRYLPQPEWGIGHLLSLAEEGAKALVQFPAREGEPVWVSTKGKALQPAALAIGTAVRTAKGVPGKVTEEVEGGRGLRRYVLALANGETDELPESEVRAEAPRPDALSSLKEARTGEARNFILRRSALLLDEERRGDALGALLASRVMVKPHQVGVVQRVLSARRPRFILADEVGLGKTIEAGMVFSALRLAGLARRVLVVAPSHLTVQWLVELFHKFNHLFTLLDAERFEKSLEERPDISPWARFDCVVTSLELLQRSAEHRQHAAAADAYWDLVIFDEAHHLKGKNAFAAATGVAQNSWGLLLLTATPMQLDPAEYHSLLTLIDPSMAPTVEAFEARLKRQEDVSRSVQALLDSSTGKKKKGAVEETVKTLAARFPQDEKLAALTTADALLAHLAETYSLSDRLIRNRRAVVGGFSMRKLHRHEVKLSKEELAARKAALEAVQEDKQLKGAVLSTLLRRLESSPAAFNAAVKSHQSLAEKQLSLAGHDAKYQAFVSVLNGIWKKEPDTKVLVFTEARETLDALKSRLLEERVEALAYHGDLPLVERDRQVARFRDPEGPKVLICTEVGGEGRNFQFSHHLVHYDLPWSPATVEQRIGRLDRIGQTKTVDIHVFEVPGTLSADVLSVLSEAVSVFTETVGGLDAVLEEVEPRLTELALAPEKQRAAYVQELKRKVTDARAQVQRAYDPLLDYRSFDKEAVTSLVSKAQRRSGIEAEEDETIEESLWSVARDLDERLEETTTELAARVGIGVDTDQSVDAFQCAFHFGHALNVEALPGLDISKERTVLGTFWRDTAVEQEEIEYFATGHPIVEALFGFLRDGPYGRNGVRFLEQRGGQKQRGLELLFHVEFPQSLDTSVGAKVPSRHLSRFLDRLLIREVVTLAANGSPKVDAVLAPLLLEQDGRSLKGDEIRSAFPELADFVDPAVAVGTRAAQAALEKSVAKAAEAIVTERELTCERMQLSLKHQGLHADQIAVQLDAERAYYQSLLDALSKVSVSLDSACAFLINR